MAGEDSADAAVFSSPEVRMAGVSGGWEQSRKDSQLGARDPDTLFAADSWEGPPTLDVWQVRTYTISRTPEAVTFLRRTQGTVDSGYRRYVR